MSKATNVSTSAKRSSVAVAILTMDQHVAAGMACFAQYVQAEAVLAEGKAFWDIARLALRDVLKVAYVQLTGKAWDEYKGKLRTEMVDGKVCATTADAGRVINNACIALKITGNGARKGGKPKGAGGRPEKESTGDAVDVTSNAPSNAARALAFIAEKQAHYVGEEDVLEMLGTLAAILADQA